MSYYIYLFYKKLANLTVKKTFNIQWFCVLMYLFCRPVHIFSWSKAKLLECRPEKLWCQASQPYCLNRAKGFAVSFMATLSNRRLGELLPPWRLVSYIHSNLDSFGIGSGLLIVNCVFLHGLFGRISLCHKLFSSLSWSTAWSTATLTTLVLTFG